MAPFEIDQFWRPVEQEISSFSDVHKLIHGVFDKWSKEGKVFAWRGVVDASWALHSSLYRRLLWTQQGDSPPDEATLRKKELAILEELHKWGLHTATHGRLSALNQLAVLQHYGAPTRLIDITFNPLIGLWFAVEQQWENGQPKSDDTDGRLFAIDISKRLINEEADTKGWEDSNDLPWPINNKSNRTKHQEWTTTVRAWKPARIDHRIAAQHGGFLVGGVPGTSGSKKSPVQWRKNSTAPNECWKIEEVRRAISIPLKFHQLINNNPGRPPENPAYTIRIKKGAKAEIRNCLEKLYGYRHETIYPDYPGFALYGYRKLKSKP